MLYDWRIFDDNIHYGSEHNLVNNINIKIPPPSYLGPWLPGLGGTQTPKPVQKTKNRNRNWKYLPSSAVLWAPSLAFSNFFFVVVHCCVIISTNNESCLLITGRASLTLHSQSTASVKSKFLQFTFVSICNGASPSYSKFSLGFLKRSSW
jgi:hypothetical protein